MSEISLDKNHPSFNDVADVVSQLVEPTPTVEILDDDREIDYAAFDGKFRDLKLEPALAETAKLGDIVNCEVIGDERMGIAVVMRSKNPFIRQRYGFFVQPENSGSTFSVWHAPARKPQKYEWIGASLLDHDSVGEATPEIINALVRSLEHRAA